MTSFGTSKRMSKLMNRSLVLFATIALAIILPVEVFSALATGGNVSTVGAYTVHTFTSSGTFTVNQPIGSVDVVIVGGGGGGGNQHAGAGGAGGVLSIGGIGVSQQSYSITVGAGGLGCTNYPNTGGNGGNSSAFGHTAVGGGAGTGMPAWGNNGGSGGADGYPSGGIQGGNGTAGQGYHGNRIGTGSIFNGGGGGGAGGTANGIHGGPPITNWAGTFGGGGGGGFGGGNGGGAGAGNGGYHAGNGAHASANTGSGGGGGGNYDGDGGNGGSGVVVIRYRTPGTSPYATGGTETTAGAYTVHTYTSGGSFNVAKEGTVEVLLVGGGGGGGGGLHGVMNGGGGGGGGVLYNTAVNVTAGNHTVSVGAGGASGTNGGNTTFAGLTAIGGGHGAHSALAAPGAAGGSGGGEGTSQGGGPGSGMAGQGNNGAWGSGAPHYQGGGGGGSLYGGGGYYGGWGAEYSISGTATRYAGGGGGGTNDSVGGSGGLGGGGQGGGASAPQGGNGAANTGGGGGGSAQWSGTGGSGGSGIVIIRYLTPVNNPPTISWHSLPSGTFHIGESLSVRATGTDPDGYLTRVLVQYQVNGGAWQDLSDNSYSGNVTSATSSVNALTAGAVGTTYRFQAKAYDLAGSESAWLVSSVYTVSNTPPVNVSMSVGGPYAFGQPISVSARSTDIDSDLRTHHYVVSHASHSSNNWEGTDSSGRKWQHYMSVGTAHNGDATTNATLVDNNYGKGSSLVPGSYRLTLNTQDSLPNYTYNAASIMASFTINKATPNASFASRSLTAPHVISAGDLNAVFSNPYSGSVTGPSGSASYNVSVGTSLGPGSHTITATYPGDSNYNSRSVSATFTVNAVGQSAVSVSPSTTTITAGQSVTFTASGGSGTKNYTWGGSASGTGNSKTVTFPDTGTYSVTVYNPANGNYSQSNTATASVSVNVTSQSNVSVTPASSTVTAGQSVTFTASGGSGTTNYTWGGSASGTGTSKTVTFNSVGSQSVTVYNPANTNYSVSNTATASVTVNAADQSTVSISPSSSTISVGQSVTFTASGGSGTLNYSWGGSASGSGSSKTVTFNSVGPQTVTVRNLANGMYSDSNTATATITVNLNNQSAVTISPSTDTVGVGDSITFTASGGDGFGAYVWGGEASGTGTSKTVTFSGSGSRSVTVYREADSEYAASNTATATINVTTGITSPANWSISRSAAESFGIETAGSNPVFSITSGSLPAGLNLDPNTGVISGTATESGTFNLDVQANDSLGISDQTMTIVVNQESPVPEVVDFESATIGSLANQQNWAVPQGSADVSTASVQAGIQAVEIPGATDSSQITRSFSGSAGQDVVFVDFYVRPAAQASRSDSSMLDVNSARVGFARSGNDTRIEAFDGTGSGSGTWVDTGLVRSNGGADTTIDWLRVTTRLDFVQDRWDLYVDGQIAMYDMGFVDVTTGELKLLRIDGATAGSTFVDQLLVSYANPAFVDADNDGLPDGWQSALWANSSITVTGKSADPDGDGLTNLEEYLLGTDPTTSDSDGDGLPDGYEVLEGLDPLVSNSGPGGDDPLPVSTPPGAPLFLIKHVDGTVYQVDETTLIAEEQ